MDVLLLLLFAIQFVCCKFQGLMHSVPQSCENLRTEQIEAILHKLKTEITRTLLHDLKARRDDRINAFENQNLVTNSTQTMNEKKMGHLQQCCVASIETKQIDMLEERLNFTDTFTSELRNKQKLLSQVFEENVKKTSSHLQEQTSSIIQIKRAFDQLSVYNKSLISTQRLIDIVRNDLDKISSKIIELNTSMMNEQDILKPLKHSVNFIVHTFLEFEEKSNSKQTEFEVELAKNAKLTTAMDKSNNILNKSMENVEYKLELTIERLSDLEENVNKTEILVSEELNNMNKSVHNLWDLLSSVNGRITDLYQQSDFINERMNWTFRQFDWKIFKAFDQLHGINARTDLMNTSISFVQDAMNSMLNETIVDLKSNQNHFESMISSLKEDYIKYVRNQTMELKENMTEYFNTSYTYVLDALRNAIGRIHEREDNITSTLIHVRNTLRSQSRTLVRLVNGGLSYGRLEVYVNGHGWGTVCDDNFGTNDANVVCRQLGYRSGSVRAQASYGQGSLNIVMDDVACTGYERQIQDCRYSRNHDCSHSEDVGIVCS